MLEIRNTGLLCPPAALSRRVFLSLALVFLIGIVGCLRAYGDVGIVLNDSLDTSIARITGSGHSAVYFSRICPDSPVKLRLCRPGEDGSVVSNYTTLGEDQPFEWNAVSLSVYLYGVEDPRFRPLLGSPEIKHALEERYRDKFLSAYCAGISCRTSGKAEWREMVGAGLSRNIYIFVVRTTLDQDRALIAELNSLPNRNHFNGFTRNCADFTKAVINSYFPHAVRRNYINDFGMTSPKSIARSLAHYALRHPEAGWRVFHFAQLPGSIKRSSEAREGTEQLYRSKKLLVPMLLFAPHALIGVALSYLTFGRFNPERVFEAHPAAPEIAGPLETVTSAPAQARATIVGTPEEWKEYQEALDSMVSEAVREEIIPNRGSLKHFLDHLAKGEMVSTDSTGALWMDVSEGGRTAKVGISASNVISPGSDPRLAYELLLARTGRVLTKPRHSRETMLELKKDWHLLQDAQGDSAMAAALTIPRNEGAPIPGAFVDAKGQPIPPVHTESSFAIPGRDLTTQTPSDTNQPDQ